jgi:hypothetical protein
MNETLEERIKIVLDCLITDMTFKYQSHKAKSEEKSINSYVSYNTAKEKVVEAIRKELDSLV